MTTNFATRPPRSTVSDVERLEARLLDLIDVQRRGAKADSAEYQRRRRERHEACSIMVDVLNESRRVSGAHSISPEDHAAIFGSRAA